MAVEVAVLVIIGVIAVAVFWILSRPHGNYSGHFDSAAVVDRTRDLEIENQGREHRNEIPMPVDPEPREEQIREREERIAGQEAAHEDRQRQLDEQRRRLEEQTQRLDQTRQEAAARLQTIMEELGRREEKLRAAGARQREVADDIARLEDERRRAEERMRQVEAAQQTLQAQIEQLRL